ncbi:Zinc finger protein 782 [Eumeta japonica]|uniref:Zinc finger protein 782 n=1 Tax=Eumeta variegata TaxID=151549 RepID=A0A4C1V4X0_EUMVA|nr:Zinc finger protein 782 [Eumeta japonica]
MVLEKALSASYRYAASRENAEIVLRNTSVYPFRLKINNIVCVYCCDMFEDPNAFRSHMNSEHSAFNVATAFANLSKSEFVKVDVLNLHCRICNVRMDNLVALAGHLYAQHCAKLHMSAQLGVQEFILEKNKWYCYVCNKKLPSLYHLNRHTGTHYLNYICDCCGRSYITESGLAAHIKNTHGQTSKYSCRRCKKQFSSMEAKKQHLRSENYCQPFGCHMCSQRFLYWELRQKHLEEVHGKPKKVFPCVDCGATFECRRLFHIHYKTLHTQDCYRCQCGLKFASKSAYEYHNVSHTGEKKFHCTICGKMFSRKKNLNQHVRIHEKDKRFACSVCSHTFVQKRSLKSHIKAHHGDLMTDFI